MFVHQVVDHSAGRFIQIGIDVRSGFDRLDIADQQYLCFVRRKQEALYIAVEVADLPAMAAVGIHHPQLVTAAFCREECDFIASVDPYAVQFRAGGMSKLFPSAAVDVHDHQFPVRFVLGYIHIRNSV